MRSSPGTSTSQATGRTSKNVEGLRLDSWFWGWFWRGANGSRPGHEYYWRWGIVVDVVAGSAVMLLSPTPLETAAQHFLLPIAGILIGLTFAWVGNAHAMLQTPEVEEVAERMAGGVERLIWEYQLAVLILLVVLVLWGLASLGILDKTWPTPSLPYVYNFLSAALYAASSLALRACWRVVRDAQNLLVLRHRVRVIREKAGLDQLPPDGSGG